VFLEKGTGDFERSILRAAQPRLTKLRSLQVVQRPFRYYAPKNSLRNLSLPPLTAFKNRRNE
jgi:hypothetical protein